MVGCGKGAVGNWKELANGWRLFVKELGVERREGKGAAGMEVVVVDEVEAG